MALCATPNLFWDAFINFNATASHVTTRSTHVSSHIVVFNVIEAKFNVYLQFFQQRTVDFYVCQSNNATVTDIAYFQNKNFVHSVALYASCNFTFLMCFLFRSPATIQFLLQLSVLLIHNA